MLLAPAEVPAAAAVFPTKFLDIRDQHVLLAGADPFAELQVPPEVVRLQIEQGLRNALLRLRRRFTAVAGDASGQVAALRSIAGLWRWS